MSQLQSLKERRLAVQSTQKITKAMKMIAVSRLRGAQLRNEKAKPYNDSVSKIVQAAVAQSPQAFDRYINADETGTDLYILIAANRGLCGSYNQNTFRLMESLIEGQRLESDAPENNTVEVITLGKKASEFIGRFEDVSHVGDFMLGDTPSFVQVEALAKHVLSLFNANNYRMIRCIGTHYKSALVQEAAITPIFPLDASGNSDESAQESDARVISMEPAPRESAAHLWRLYVRSKLYQCLVESVTSEHASRMRAMDNASRNAENMIDELTLLYNRKRQAEITSELTEIIAGSESMKGEN